MIFVIGSAYQGKTAFVKERFSIKEEEIADGESCSYGELYKAKAVNHFEWLIYRLMKEERPVEAFVEELLMKNKELIIILAEIGSGLVPVDAFDRIYREKVGRTGCLIVKYADEVYRIHCGIGTKIYEKKSGQDESESPSKIQVYLIRHSTTKGNLEKRYVGSTDEPLCDEGIELAMEKKLPQVDKVYTSPLCRCIQTTEILYPHLKKAIIPGLRETDFGVFEYKNHVELDGSEDYQSWIDSGGKSGFPQGESFEEANERAGAVFRFIIKDAFEHKHESIAIVTHGGTIMAIMSQFSGEKRDYFDWKAGNCEGYLLEIDGGSKCYR
ncbi:bifunctional adenosylcobinamide kinase/adenosylcobinamide-phosphate guanylyltransferase [Konateibacter massiliensis]|uniref:bifunctional adenosylcobinamide kinase/adenosylcobinamide-phosphate guanylyltransferase n=1 Tax=Konateibacter massiliensis TaxID=2002841 RepID=UPI000C15EA43|nr:bifunctional adenosylcobinamide kinase/adenosylcobinamide-phosphate guanylyltransferase [Konateibacter massiliensis]